MSVEELVARRYAAAYHDLAAHDGKVERWREGLAQASSALSRADVGALLADPRVERSQRRQLAVEAIGDVATATRNLVRLLVDHGRVAALPRVLDEYDRITDRASGRVRADVLTAVPVDRDLERRIGRALEDGLGSPVQTTVRQDPSILGGLVIRIGDRVIDGSVRARLDQLRAAIA